MNARDPLVRRVQAAASDQLSALQDRDVVVGVSGGADSLALLHVLLQLRPELRTRPYAAHLDHALRPESGRQTEELAETVRALGVPFLSEREDVGERAVASGLSIEAAAREVRYLFLGRQARRLGAIVAVAHNQNDQAETVLLNLARGSGTRGLTGMSPVAVVPYAPGIPLVRPFLSIGAGEIRAYCTRHGLPVIEDPSNLSDQFTRNRVRHRVLPELEKVNAQAIRHIADAAQALLTDEEALDSLAADLYASSSYEHGRAVALRTDALRGQPDALVLRVLRLAVLRVTGTLDGLNRKHLVALRRLVATPDGGRSLDLPRGLRVLRGGERVVLWTGELAEDALYPLPLLADDGATPGRLTGRWHWVAERHGRASCGGPLVPGLHEHALLTDEPLLIRAARPGERFRPLGMEHSKKVSDFLVDAKVPRHIRGRVPLVVAGDEPVLLAGWRLDDRWKLADPSGPHMCVRFWREPA